jgi:hypothetical protein
MNNTQSGWKIDKHIPVAVIITIIMQTFGVIWWAAGIDGRISAIEKMNLEERTKTIERDIPVIREKINNIEKSTDRIEKKLDKLSLYWIPKKQTIYTPATPLEEMTLAQLMGVETSV